MEEKLGQSNKKWVSSSSLLQLQRLHNLSSLGRLSYLPVSILSLWLLILSFNNVFLEGFFLVKSRYQTRDIRNPPKPKTSCKGIQDRLESGFHSLDSWFQVPGVLPENWVCAARFLKPLPYFRPRYVILPTLFQISGARFSKVPVTLRARNQIFKSKYKE